MTVVHDRIIASIMPQLQRADMEGSLLFCGAGVSPAHPSHCQDLQAGTPAPQLPRGSRLLRVLASAFACGPRWGSEIGMGWNWVRHLSDLCELTVITEAEFRKDIEEELAGGRLASPPQMHYIDIGQAARRRCWNQGDWRFYLDYRRWQKQACELASRLIQSGKFDLLHQLNMTGYREPGYLWQLPLPLVWGPVGGHAQMPWRFLPGLGLKGSVYHACRNVLNAVQMRVSRRVGRCAKQAGAVVASTLADQQAIKRIHRRPCLLMNEQGSASLHRCNTRKQSDSAGPLRIAWVGKLVSRKALGLAVRSLAAMKCKNAATLEIVGDGPDGPSCKALARSLGVADACRWHGAISHEAALDVMASCDCLMMTSLQEGTPATLMEAISLHLPIICHDVCGFSSVVDDSCGIKVPPRSPTQSVRAFAAAMDRLAADRDYLSHLSEGSAQAAAEHAWQNKARWMIDVYQQVLDAATSRPHTCNATEMTV